MLLWFVAGIVIGWLIEMVIDWRFWRRRAFSSSEPTNLAALNELTVLRQKVKEYEDRLLKLEIAPNSSVNPNSSATNPSSSKSG